MNNDVEKVRPFDSFTAVCKILVWAGYYKPLNKTTTRLKRVSHQIYRLMVLLFSAMYNLQHIVFMVQHRHDLAKIMDCLIIEIPQINLFTMILNILVQTRKIDKLQEILTGSIFEATDEQEELKLKTNKVEMDRLHKFLVVGATIATFLWPSSFFAKRYNDRSEVVNSYVPLKTDTWHKFTLSVLLETGPIPWIGYGNLALHHLMAAYYAQAHTQLKIIKYRLKKLASISNVNNDMTRRIQYKDVKDETIKINFVQILKRYETVAWYKDMVDDVFNVPLSIQFFSSATVMCIVIFRMTIISVTSFPFIFLAIVFIILLVQVFMYCYYGNLVEFESHLINDSVYKSDWLSLSPSFRRSLLIAMSRWSIPIRPQVCGIIPLSLNTFIQIVKASYTLYTVLVR